MVIRLIMAYFEYLSGAAVIVMCLSMNDHWVSRKECHAHVSFFIEQHSAIKFARLQLNFT